MAEKVFVDTNVLIYAHDQDARKKQPRAAEWLRKLWNSGMGRLSTQVLGEFYVTVTRKLGKPLSRSVAREVVRNYGLWVESAITPPTVIRASEISEAWQVSFWNSMILAAAEQDSADILLTEDLSHHQIIAGVRIVNPFV
jgi:predicted nucleic acid-binding protein